MSIAPERPCVSMRLRSIPLGRVVRIPARRVFGVLLGTSGVCEVRQDALDADRDRRESPARAQIASEIHPWVRH